MKKTNRTLRPVVFLLTVLIALPLLLCACGETADQPSGEAKTVTLESVATTIEKYMNNSTALTDRQESFLENFMQLNPADYAGYRVKTQTEGGSIDEYGVLELKEGDSSAKAEETVKNYLDFYLNTLWDDRYKPEEKPKIENATYRVWGGKFVVYLILDKDTQAIVNTALDELF